MSYLIDRDQLVQHSHDLIRNEHELSISLILVWHQTGHAPTSVSGGFRGRIRSRDLSRRRR
jgi:hypothetical protein